jgi:hypothetical protein
MEANHALGQAVRLGNRVQHATCPFEVNPAADKIEPPPISRLSIKQMAEVSP